MAEHIAAEASDARGCKVERLVERLRQSILTSRYPPGQRLIESELTRDFRVSRGPLREAFRRLSAEGLVQIVPNRGALVRKLSYGETIELFQIRNALEPLAARLAAMSIDQGDNRQRFERAIRPIWSDARRRDAAAHQENRLFHLAIFDVCGNAQLAELSTPFQLPLIMLQLSGAKALPIYQESVIEHREIATAILHGDGDGAEAAMNRHLVRAYQILDAMPPSIFRSPQDRAVE